MQSTISQINRWAAKGYIVALSVLSTVFLVNLATAEPRCVQCSVHLVTWALPYAQWLAIGWIVASIGFLWNSRLGILRIGRQVRQSLRQLQPARSERLAHHSVQNPPPQG
ncbi:MAG: hypothetical protein OXU61_09285 [Gammaproteobacteria bacterium]|nr:hypothetical protein [Gammaproteobacteria bacterium]